MGASEIHPCPVCGYELPFAPWDDDSAADEMCPCCGIQFGYDDMAGGDLQARQAIYREWRSRWIGQGMPWYSKGWPKPIGWNPKEQLRNAQQEG